MCLKSGTFEQIVITKDRTYHCNSGQEEVIRIDRLAEEIGTVQDIKNSYNPILNVILMALDAPPVFMRTKALRALGQIVTSDPTILSTVCNQKYSLYLFLTSLAGWSAARHRESPPRQFAGSARCSR